MTNRFNVLAVNDESDFCECCGRKGLKKVVWIEDLENGDIKHFGTTCAAAPVKGFGVDAEIKQAIVAFQEKTKAAWALAYHMYRKAGGKYIGNVNDGWKANDQGLLEQCFAQAKGQG